MSHSLDGFEAKNSIVKDVKNSAAWVGGPIIRLTQAEQDAILFVMLEAIDTHIIEELDGGGELEDMVSDAQRSLGVAKDYLEEVEDYLDRVWERVK